MKHELKRPAPLMLSMVQKRLGAAGHQDGISVIARSNLPTSRWLKLKLLPGTMAGVSIMVTLMHFATACGVDE
jgi:hypothetical protein